MGLLELYKLHTEILKHMKYILGEAQLSVSSVPLRNLLNPEVQFQFLLIKKEGLKSNIINLCVLESETASFSLQCGPRVKGLFCFLSKLKQAYGPRKDARTNLHKANMSVGLVNIKMFMTNIVITIRCIYPSLGFW